MLTLLKINEIKEQVASWKKQGLIIGFVPTMGALHVGHASLIKEARKSCDKVVVSIFVNPTQFGPNEDFDKYPKTLENDQKICEEIGVDLIFAPSAAEMYKDREKLTKVLPPSSYVNKLCGKSRHGHFDGVAQVVTKLFNIVQPDKAFFGQKDAQQLIIIRKICSDLNMSVEIVGCPIIRDEDGLACSSRNTYLTDEDRKNALSLHKVLFKVEELYKNGNKQKRDVFDKALKLLDGSAMLEYLESVDAATLENVDLLKSETLIAIAVKIGEVRLIDNVILK